MVSSGCSYFHRALVSISLLLFLFLITSGADASSDTENYWWDLNYEIAIDEGSEYPRAMEFSPTGDALAFFAGNLTIVDTATRLTILEWRPPYGINPSFIRWSNDGGLIAWRRVDEIQVFSIETTEVIAEIEFEENVRFFSFSPNDAFLGVLTEHYLHIVNTTTWNYTTEIEVLNTDVSTAYSFNWHPSGDSLVILGGIDGYLYEANTWEYLGTLKSFRSGKWGVWTNDGKFIHSTWTSIMEYDLENATDTYLVGGLDRGYIKLIFDDLSDDIIIHEQYLLPKVFDRAQRRYIQHLSGLSLFSNATTYATCHHISLSSSSQYLAVLWTKDYSIDHLTVLIKKNVSVPPSLVERPDPAFAMLKEYDIGFQITPLIGPDSITSVILDVGGTTRITWSIEDGSMSTSNSHLILEGVTLSRNVGSSSSLVFTIWFNWTFPELEGCNLTLSLRLIEGVDLRWEYVNAFEVVTSLELSGQVQAEGEFQGPLENNSWTRAGETINWTLPTITYKGYPEVNPHSHHVVWFFFQDGNLEWTGNPGTDGHARASSNMPIMDQGAFVFGAIATTAHDNRTFATSIIHLRVDGSPPVYVEHIPEPGVWQATTMVYVGTRAMDENGSGLNETSMQISWRWVEDGPWSEWSDVSRTDMGDEATFGWLELELQEGRANEIRWICSDNVGNTNETGPMEVLVDLHHVTFNGFMPDSWINTTDASCRVNISDVGGSGVSGPSIQVRWSTNNISWYGEWVSLDLTGTDELWNVLRAIPLVAGADNYVQWRAEDVAGTGLTDSRHYRVWIDTTPPVLGAFSPAIIQQAHEFVVSIEVSDSGGSGLDIADVEWRLDGQNWQVVDVLSDDTASATVMVAMDGNHSVIFRAWDGARNPTVSSVFVVTVDTSPPEIIQNEPAPGSYIIGTQCTTRVHIRDMVSGVNVSSVMFSLRRGSGSDWSEWQPVENVTEDNGIIVASMVVELDPNHDNWIRFRASDLVGNGPSMTLDIRLPVDLPPTVVISSPDANDTYLDNMQIMFDSSGSRDPEGNITVEWNIDDGWYETTDPNFKVRLPAGILTITLVVIDEAGQRNETTMTMKVLDTEEAIWSGQWWVILVILVAVIVTATTLVHLRYRT